MKKILLAIVLAAAGCSKRAPAPPPESPLKAAARLAGSSAACSRVIPSQWSPSLPVPALDGGRLVYRMFFYGRDGNPTSGFFFHHAEGDATLAADGRVLACSVRGGRAALLPKFAPKPGVTLDEIMRRQGELYPQLEDAAKLYSLQRPPTPDESARVAATAAAFAFFVEDGRGPDYRTLSPDFWAWVEKNGGQPPAAR